MKEILNTLGIQDVNYGASAGTPDGWIQTSGEELISFSPIDGNPLATIIQATAEDYEQVIQRAQNAFKTWRMTPAPKRGEIVREIGDQLRKYRPLLGKLVSLEMGKILAEGEGEVQEMIDIADFAVGLSRQLYGLTMQSERPYHRMYEQWHPLGPVGVITAFNFPVAVWSWNAFIAAVCGDVILWKPSSKVPLTAIAVQHILDTVLEKYQLKGVFNLVIGRGQDIGERLIHDSRLPLVSATGSCRMGRRIGEAVAKRLGRSILELGGNNAVIVAEDADLDLVTKAIFFGAVGTAGQRCTTTRRILVHHSRKDELLDRLVHVYKQVKIGDPLDEKTLMGPLVDQGAVTTMMNALNTIKNEGGAVVYGGKHLSGAGFESGCYVEPTLVEAPNDLPMMQEETFAPILYIVEYQDIDEAIALHNGVAQGLSSSIFTQSLRYAEQFLSHQGSDCGIANVNLGTNGAEIGGAFGGEKDTGGGREAGSDAWKAYMRRQTTTINWGKDLPLAQGISFSFD